MSRREQARISGCFKCRSKNLSEKNDETICNDCGCVHGDSYYSFVVPKEKHREINWFSKDRELILPKI